MPPGAVPVAAHEPPLEGEGPIGRRVGLTLGALAFGLVLFLPSALHRIPGAGSRPAAAAAVAVLMAVLWFTEAIPVAWTACLPIALFPLLGVFEGGPLANLGAAIAPFGDAYILLFIGGMAIGAAMEEHGLHRRLALTIMKAVGTDPRRLLLGLLLATAAVSLWISNTATAAMMCPIALALVRQLEGRSGRRLVNLGGALMLAVAWGSNLGGIGTKIGTATNSIFCGYLAKALGVDMSFLRFAAVGLPFVLIMMPVAWAVLWRVARRDGATGQGREVIERELAALGPMSGKEKAVAATFALAGLLWILGDPIQGALVPALEGLLHAKVLSKHYEAGVALAAGFFLLATRVLSLGRFVRQPWATLLLLGGSFAMASGLEASGLSRWLAQQLEGVARLPFVAQVAIASFGTVALTAVASNTATVNVTLTVLPRSIPVLFTSAIAASCDFALPAGTPPNAIVFGSGYVRIGTMMRAGFLLDFLTGAILTLYALLWMPLLLG